MSPPSDVEASLPPSDDDGSSPGGGQPVEKATAIRVVVRCRPVLPREATDGQRMTSLSLSPSEGTVSLTAKTCEAPSGSGSADREKQLGGAVRDFGFDAVLGPESTQAEAIDAVNLKRMVQASLEGYHATVFAYGQTGSGKTHTMEGFEYAAGGGEGAAPRARLDDTPAEHLGVIPAAAVMLFDEVKAAEAKGRSVRVAVTYVQIYKEVCHDLLLDKSNAANAPTAAFAKSVRDRHAMPGLRMRWSKNLGFHLEGVRTVPVEGPDELMALFKSGVRNKVMASHKLNMSSSRSHAILTVHVTASTPNDPSEVTRAKLSLVDLAGSERQSATGVGGEMMREAIAINKSLFTLRKVITSLAESRYQGLHVPYRDSKLTSLLQDSLGGSSLTVMVACLSPCDGHHDENLSTLEYASRASCIANRVAVNEDPKSKLIRELRAQNAFLTAQLAHMRAAGYELPAALDGFDLEEESKKLRRGAEKRSASEAAALAGAKHRSDHGGISMGLKPVRSVGGDVEAAAGAGGGGTGKRSVGRKASALSAEEAEAVSAADKAMKDAEAASEGAGRDGGHTREMLESMKLIKEQVANLAAANTSLRREHGAAVNRAEELEDERDALMQEITEVRDKNDFLESLVAMEDFDDGGKGGPGRGNGGGNGGLAAAGGAAAHTANRAALLELLDLREECRTLKERLSRWEAEGKENLGGNGGGGGGTRRAASGASRAAGVGASAYPGRTVRRTASSSSTGTMSRPRSSSSSSLQSSSSASGGVGMGTGTFVKRAMLSVADLKNAIALGEVPTKAPQIPKGGPDRRKQGGGSGGSGFNTVFDPYRTPATDTDASASLRVTSAGRMVADSATVNSVNNQGRGGGTARVDAIAADPEAALAELMKSRQALVRDHFAG